MLKKSFFTEERKIVFLLFFMFILILSGFSQNDKNFIQQKRIDIIENSEYIFEGKVMGNSYQFIDVKGEIRSLLTVQVRKVFRGPQNWRNKNVHVIKLGASALDKNGNLVIREKSVPNAMGYSNINIFFCSKNDITELPQDFNTPDIVVLKNYSEYDMVIGKSLITIGEWYGLYGLRFKNDKAVYRFLKKQNNIVISKEN